MLTIAQLGILALSVEKKNSMRGGEDGGGGGGGGDGDDGYGGDGGRKWFRG